MQDAIAKEREGQSKKGGKKVVRQSADKRMELSLRLLPEPKDPQKLTDELTSQLKLAKVELESASPGGRQVVEINQRLLSLERQIGLLKQQQKCYHGQDCCIPEGHVAWSFMEDFDKLFQDKSKSRATVVHGAMHTLSQKHPGIWEHSTRNIVREWMIDIGVTVLRKNDVCLQMTREIAGAFALAILILEKGSVDADVVDVFHPPAKDLSRMKDIDLVQGCLPSLLIFFSERVPCKCLDKYAELKSRPKSGICHHCRERKRRNTLLVCGDCLSVQFCSKHCQAENWHKHKESCMQIRAELRTKSGKA